MTGEIPTELVGLANLEELYLWGNEGHDELGSLDQLNFRITSDRHDTYRTGQPRYNWS